MEAATEKAEMESVKEIQQTLQEFPVLTPGVLCAAFYIPGPGASSAQISAFSDALSRRLRHEPCDRRESDSPGEALGLRWASCYIPQHGEDAHFGHAHAGVIGVADGVGGWRRSGVDAAAFSRALMSSALAEVTTIPSGESLHPKTLLEKAYTAAAAAGTPGASTACILSLSDNTLRWAYVGDSGFAVLRGGEIIKRSMAQQRHFNCPVHLAADCGESLQSAKVGARAVEEGDIVVAGTDGLFDNMTDRQIEQAVKFGTALRFSPKNMADLIAGVAYEISCSKKKDSPFAMASRLQLRNKSKHHVGGKKDDITVVVAFV